jgi:hypothetical protein
VIEDQHDDGYTYEEYDAEVYISNPDEAVENYQAENMWAP